MTANPAPLASPEAARWAWYEHQDASGATHRIKAIKFDPALGLYHYDPAWVTVAYSSRGDFLTRDFICQDPMDPAAPMQPLRAGDWLVQHLPGIAPQSVTVTSPAVWEAAGWRPIETLRTQEPLPQRLHLGVRE